MERRYSTYLHVIPTMYIYMYVLYIHGRCQSTCMCMSVMYVFHMYSICIPYVCMYQSQEIKHLKLTKKARNAGSYTVLS